MLSNLEQALIDTIKAKRDPTYQNVLSIYCDTPGIASGFPDHDPAVYFHHSLDKYADAEDKVDSPFAKYIRVIRAQYWGIVIDLAEVVLGTENLPCPCKCGKWDTSDGIRRQLGVISDDKTSTPRSSGPRRRKTKASYTNPDQPRKCPKIKKNKENRTIFTPSGSRISVA
ncbi:hypothetical protein HYPSUDRAFT_47518 [Hypholoma sublateritium FD-334 SS-4]|uniref:Uncharacterized protein n=1 Tax=Hypholoma sublateritium (strain FD-334 SS-4) TaxID=945553 RepID=A0A0D2KNX9_HYPSF|nr:hypothetical protein HYPSUDRAFT_47518 [Hypholoma sublateritium FD-334 SS-4]